MCANYNETVVTLRESVADVVVNRIVDQIGNLGAKILQRSITQGDAN
jgi:hypothetical protein